MRRTHASEGIHVREMRAGEEPALADLVKAAVDALVAPDLSDTGIATINEFARAENIAARDAANHFTLVAIEGHAGRRAGQPLGMLQFRLPAHLLMLFVHPHHHRRGVARMLVMAALARCAAVEVVTVHASPNSVGFYAGLGFQVAGAECEDRGVRIVPMRCRMPACSRDD